MALSIVQTAFSSTALSSSALICRKTMKHASTLFRFSSSLLSVRSYNSLSMRKSTLLSSSINHGGMMKRMSSSIHTNGFYERDHKGDYNDDDGVEEDPDPRLEAWDLRDPHSPRMIPMPPVSFDNNNYPIAYRSEQEHKQKKHPSIRDAVFLAVAETTGELFHVRRFNREMVGALAHGHGYYTMDEYYGPKIGLHKTPPYPTVGFDVHRYDPESGSLVYMDRSLDGLALFIGSNNGFGLPAADFPELKPDAIYYTEPPKWHLHEVDIFNHDVGIFNYRDESFAPCFYPVDVQSSVRVSGPKWFTPTPLVRFPFLVQNDDGTLSRGAAALNMASKSYAGLIFNSFTRHGRKLSTMINANVPKTKRSPSTPWLMLPPVFQGDNKNKNLDMFYEFYSLGTDHIEAWDLRDPFSPKMVPMPPVAVDKHNYPVASHSELESDLKRLCRYDAVFLVLSEHTDELFQVRQYVLHQVGPDGSFVDDVYYEEGDFDESVPYKTVGFDVHKYEPKTGKMVYMDRNLGGLALFVGPHEGFALPAHEYQGLKPNSIYYTDMYYSDYENRYGGHDIGIFNYENETFSPCYYPCDLKSMMTRIEPNPIWFRPSPCVEQRSSVVEKPSSSTRTYSHLDSLRSCLNSI
ncbi:hypothetical protein STAS_05402 [Striga asiatica]|uniref:KIB1-4 beta-propeller domain-containing protein n=1 Tax=Striga asiatica TaxID=4170 RepID=A0A5A7P9L9_STRAF|nr:hypothetical protein STAS_05402 [Striga asiatica]